MSILRDVNKIKYSIPLTANQTATDKKVTIKDEMIRLDCW